MALPTKVQNYLAVLTPIGQLTDNETLQAVRGIHFRDCPASGSHTVRFTIVPATSPLTENIPSSFALWTQPKPVAALRIQMDNTPLNVHQPLMFQFGKSEHHGADRASRIFTGSTMNATECALLRRSRLRFTKL
jgi:hypothetical protein